MMHLQISCSKGSRLTEAEKDTITKIAQQFGRTEKIKLLEINVKKYDVKGKRIKYTVQVRADTQHGFLTASGSNVEGRKRDYTPLITGPEFDLPTSRVAQKKGQQWQLNLALKKAFKRLGKECERSTRQLATFGVRRSR